jgi:translocation protein SEC63
MDTVRLYHWYLGTSSQLNVQRLIMIIGASGEFYSRHNNEIAEREEDKAPVEALIRKLGNVREKNREARISEGYSLKARTLLHAHFMRQHVPVKQLQDDQASIIRRCPLLLREMLTIISEMTLQLQGQQDQLKRTKTKRAKRNRRYRSPGVAAVAACMKLSQMVIQAVWDRGENSHPLLMLPYVTTNTVHFFRGRKTHIRGVRDFVQLPDGRRRGLLRDALSDGLSDDPNLTDDQYDEKVGERYDEVMAVCGGFPDLHMDVKFKVLGETETGYVTTNALVTAVISLKRKSLQDLIESQQTAAEGEDVDGKVDDAEKVICVPY